MSVCSDISDAVHTGSYHSVTAFNRIMNFSHQWWSCTMAYITAVLWPTLHTFLPAFSGRCNIHVLLGIAWSYTYIKFQQSTSLYQSCFWWKNFRFLCHNVAKGRSLCVGDTSYYTSVSIAVWLFVCVIWRCTFLCVERTVTTRFISHLVIRIQL